MTKQVVALSVDKVQAFLTEVIHAHVQEKQKEEDTLKSIVKSSHSISRDFHNDIKQKFSEDALLACSGVYIFTTELPEEEIKSKCNELFCNYYLASQGQQMLRYVSFPLENMDKLEAIRRAKGLLKSSDCTRSIIAKNQGMLFTFQETVIEKVKDETEQVNEDKISYPSFAEHINKLFRPMTARESNENRFRIAVIKADLDGMGAMFQNINTYESYKAISDTLYKVVCLEGLHIAAESVLPDQQGWLMPFYIAGDDIFFAVAVCDLTYGIEVCRKILDRINAAIEKKVSNPLTMSIGVEVTFNRQPVRYYMERVEEELMCAKRTKVLTGNESVTEPNMQLIPDILKSYVRMKISIYGSTFLDLDEQTKEKPSCMYKKHRPNCTCQQCSLRRAKKKAMRYTPIWRDFRRDVEFLQGVQLRRQGCDEYVGTPGFFYTLLEKLENPAIRGNERMYVNSVLYHLIPRSLGDLKRREDELILKEKIIHQLYTLENEQIEWNEVTKHRLEAYLRLMLLFSDARFVQSSAKEQPQTDVQKSKNNNWTIAVRKHLIKGPAKYLNASLMASDAKELYKYFACEGNYKIKKEKRAFDVPCLKRLYIKKSMFIKLRNTERISVKQAAEMIAMQNGASLEEVKAFNKERSESQKAPYKLFFDKEKFVDEGLKGEGWTSDFIDSVMLLYAYNELSIEFKGLYPKNPENEGGIHYGKRNHSTR